MSATDYVILKMKTQLGTIWLTETDDDLHYRLPGPDPKTK